ncbi:MAG TPA: hypothetical protein VN150_17725 [Ochrobactrum sp.]|nr:hypothetical protein [Ochrobactrum sp.]
MKSRPGRAEEGFGEPAAERHVCRVAIRSFTSFVDGGFLVIRRSNGPDNSLAQRFIDEFWAYHETLLAQP